MRRTFLFLYLNFCFLYLLAQSDSLVFYPVNNPFLHQYNIRKITTTQDGKLWLSLDKAVVSFDGNEVKAFTHVDFFKSACFLNDKLYLVEYMGLYDFEIRTGRIHFLKINLAPENSVPVPPAYTELFADSDETIWAGRVNGFVHYIPSTKANTYYPVYSAQGKTRVAVNSFTNDINQPNILWLGTDDGIFRFDKKTQELKRDFRCAYRYDSTAYDTRILKIHAARGDTIWFTAAGRGIGCYDIKTGRYNIYPYNTEAAIFNSKDLIFFQPKDDDEYYIGSSSIRPSVFNIHTRKYSFNTKIFNETSILNIQDFLADKSGNVWCVISGRLYHATAQGSRFATISLNDSDRLNKETPLFRTIIWDDQKKCYYVSFNNTNKILVLDTAMRIIKSIPLDVLTNRTSPFLIKPEPFDIVLDKKGRLWFCGNSLTIYDSFSRKMVPVQKLFPKLKFQNQQFQNIVCRDNYLFLQPANLAYRAIYRINLASYNYDSIPIPYEIIPTEDGNSVNRKFFQENVVIDSKSRYAYIGVENYIIQIDLDTKKARKVIRVAIRDCIFWYVLDDDDRLWVRSTDGIKIIDPESLRIIKKIYDENSTPRYRTYNAEGFGLICLLYADRVRVYDYRKNKEYNLPLSDGLLSELNYGISCANKKLFVGSGLESMQYIPLSSVISPDTERKCYLTGIQVYNQPYLTDTLPEYLHSLQLPYNKNFVTFSFSSTEFDQAEKTEYRYKLYGVDKDWVYTDYSKRTISYAGLKPGNYIFYAGVRNKDGSWSDSEQNLRITIVPAWWQTTWFKTACIIAAFIFAFVLIRWRVKTVRKQEQEKARIEKELLELEAKALRAQMNPHFIFNCMNSIKSLIQKDENEKAINYLTTFSKLIRTIFQNSDKREITLFDEIETCRLYTQLESLRFNNKFSYEFEIDETLDLKSTMVPALILQPFIENAIWHGIMPTENGGKLAVKVGKTDHTIHCIIEDDGIGREVSMGNKFLSRDPIHQSKGEYLTQARLDLDNLLNERNAKIQIIDNKDRDNKSHGTTVILSFRDDQ